MSNEKIKTLGELVPVELRDFWEDEAGDFTPWLAEDKNLNLLGKTIGIEELELIATESPVGGFKVDILAKDSELDKYVIIENQLEKTDHKHLGQLLTYASGYEAMAIVWIASKFCEEHRRALDWLNEKTKEGVYFFGIEIQLWKIGNSEPAPKFNLVSQPNDWAKNINPNNSSSREYSETKLLQEEFWSNLKKYMEGNKTSLKLRNPKPKHWYSIAVGKTGFRLSLTLNSTKKRIGCELYMSAKVSKPAFEQLHEDKEDIEKELGILQWQELPKKGASRIAKYKNIDFTVKSNWEEIFQWFKERVEAFHEAFSHRVKSLDIEN